MADRGRKVERPMRLSFHQNIALSWLLGSSFGFGPLLAEAKAADAGAIIGYGVVFVTAMILVAPLMLHWPRFKAWFCWTDAMSDAQRQALEQRDVRHYYRIASENGYGARLAPYARRLMMLVVGATAIGFVLDGSINTPLATAVVVFLPFYPMGALLMALASVPLIKIWQKKFRRIDG